MFHRRINCINDTELDAIRAANNVYDCETRGGLYEQRYSTVALLFACREYHKIVESADNVKITIVMFLFLILGCAIGFVLGSNFSMQHCFQIEAKHGFGPE